MRHSFPGENSREPKGRHPGFLRTPRRVRYAIALLHGALADPEVRGHVALVGTLFPRRRGSEVTVEQLDRALAARHPMTGRLLRARVSSETRVEGESRVSNRVYGLDSGLACSKAVSVAALLFDDRVVLTAALEAMTHAAEWLTRAMDRRIRKGGRNGTTATRTGAAFVVPETAGREGQPHLHAHVLIPNLTIGEKAGRRKTYAAGHFRRITQLAKESRRRMNERLFKKLREAGYAVEIVDDVCVLPSVSPELCERLSPTRAKLAALAARSPAKHSFFAREHARLRDSAYLTNRSAKEIKPLAQWRDQWINALSVAVVENERVDYFSKRIWVAKPHSADIPGPETPPIIAALKDATIAAHRGSASNEDDALEHRVTWPTFRHVGADVHRRVRRMATEEDRAQRLELVYDWPAQREGMAEHMEALRTLLRLVFPRVTVRLRFSASQGSDIGAARAGAGDQSFSHLVLEAAKSLDAELRGNALVQKNWPAVLHWLHAELAKQSPELPPVRRAPKPARKAPKVSAPAPVIQTPAQPSGLIAPSPVPETPVLDMEMLP